MGLQLEMLKQGALGDCWFLGSLSCVATRDDLIQPVFEEADVENGRYTLRFWKAGQWQQVTVDDYLPCGKSGLPVFVQSADLSELWVMIAEKAYAKLHGCYAALEAGSVSEGLVDLTGGAPEELDLATDEGRGAFWSKLQQYVDEKWLMGCGFSVENEVDPGNGLMRNHAYAILNAVEVDGIRLIQLRNPWGEREWTGDWSDKSDKWTPALRSKLNLSDANDGVFWMCEADFLLNYNKFYGVRLYEDKFGKKWQHLQEKGSFVGKSAGGCLNSPTWVNNPQYCIRVSKPDTDLYVCLSQPDVRLQNTILGQRAKYDHEIGFCIFNTEESGLKKSALSGSNELVLRSSFVNLRSVASDIKLLPGKDYILMPSTFEPGVEIDYVLDIFADEDVELFAIPEAQKEIIIDDEWAGNSAGGCVKHQTWKDNPQYYFFAQENTKASIVLSQEGESKELTYASLFLCKADSPGEATRLKKYKKDWWKTAFTNARLVGGIVDLPKSDIPYILIPSTYEPKVERKFRITIRSASDKTSEVLPCVSEEKQTSKAVIKAVLPVEEKREAKPLPLPRSIEPRSGLNSAQSSGDSSKPTGEGENGFSLKILIALAVVLTGAITAFAVISRKK